MALPTCLKVHRATQTSPEVPEILNDQKNGRLYRKLELLGEGGFGRCYKMRDILTGDIFAVKVIPIENSARLEMSLQEAAILKKLRHQHIVSFSHHTEDENFMYIFMELCSRGSMQDILKERHHLSNPEVRYYMRQLISALKYICGEGYVHRDLKLENLLISENMELKLADFGFATKLEMLETKQKSFCGTRPYVAPEVWDKRGHGPEVDVWALGCIMYVLLVGKLPFSGKAKTFKQRVMKVKYTLPESLSLSARNLISWIFQRNPQDRPTLDQILNHKFFTKGFTPVDLPSSSCRTVPEFTSANRVKGFFNRLSQRVSGKKTSKVDLPEHKTAGRPVGPQCPAKPSMWTPMPAHISNILSQK